MKPPENKPPYRVPSMAEIGALPWNGFTVASTFSGCGGSCLGYRMAGFKVAWANEFIESARETYLANSTGTIMDARDIRLIQPEEILAALKLKPGELDVLEGSPPCASFSTAGKRAADWGKVKKYSDGAQRTDDLFHQYVRLLRGLRPKVFQAENVSGLVKGVAKGYFLEILAAMKASGYRVTCRVLDAQWLGVPQQRQRTIFIGVREDLVTEPVHPRPLPYRYSVRDALPWITDARQTEVFNEPDRVFTDTPSPSVTTLGIGAKRNDSVVVEAETDISRYCTGKEWDNLKEGEQSSKYFSMIKLDRNKPSPSILASHGSSGIACPVLPTEKRKFTIAELRLICAFPDDFILCGSYAQQWERLGRSVPPVMMSHIAATIRDEILTKLNQ
jgi:DNA (cytosine-5)-methyltransferase 1